MRERKTWIDLLRGFSMLAILLDHTEIYYTGGNIIDYNLYVANVLVVFFFLSGYLFHKDSGFSLRSKLISIGRGILMPYFIFTCTLAVPKALAHGSDIANTFLAVLTGEASWFIAALAVAETAFALLLWISRGKWCILLPMVTLSFAGCVWLSTCHFPLYWQLDNACMALPILYLGYVYHRHEQAFNAIHSPFSTSFLLLCVVVMKIYEYENNINLLIKPIAVTNWYVFVIDMTFATLFLVHLAKYFNSIGWMEWIGCRSIVFYFLSGGIPLLVSVGLQKANMSYSGEYYQVMTAYLLVCLFTAFLTWLIYRFVPFITGRKMQQ